MESQITSIVGFPHLRFLILNKATRESGKGREERGGVEEAIGKKNLVERIQELTRIQFPNVRTNSKSFLFSPLDAVRKGGEKKNKKKQREGEGKKGRKYKFIIHT